MAFIFVQYWGPLPTIYEGFMGDIPPTSQPGGNLTNNHQGSGMISSEFPSPRVFENNDPGKAYYSAPSPSQLQQQQGQQHMRPDSFAMNPLSASLPDVSYQNYHLPGQRFQSNSPASTILYQVPNIPQFAGQAPMNQPGSAPYNIQFQPQYQNVYAPHYNSNHPQQSPHQLSGATPGTNQIYQNQGFMGPSQMQQPASPYFVQTGQYGQGQVYSGNNGGAQYGSRGNFQGAIPQQRSNDFSGGAYSNSQPGRPSSIGKLPYRTLATPLSV